jgi:hypothetical protein
LVDGHWFAQDGSGPVWIPPRWIRILESQGYHRATEGEPYFVISGATGELATFGEIRAAFRFVLDHIGTSRQGPEWETLTIDCRTPSGRAVRVVQGRSVIGMAHGALMDEPITIIEAPAD